MVCKGAKRKEKGKVRELAEKLRIYRREIGLKNVRIKAQRYIVEILYGSSRWYVNDIVQGVNLLDYIKIKGRLGDITES